jgi:hypothetical protein
MMLKEGNLLTRNVFSLRPTRRVVQGEVVDQTKSRCEGSLDRQRAPQDENNLQGTEFKVSVTLSFFEIH